MWYYKKIHAAVFCIVVVMCCTLQSAISQENNIAEVLRYGWKKSGPNPAVWELVYSEPRLSIKNNGQKFLDGLFRGCASGSNPRLTFAMEETGFVVCDDENSGKRKFSWTIQNDRLLLAEPSSQVATQFTFAPHPKRNRIIINEFQKERAQKFWQIVVRLESNNDQ